jgi:protein-S-isoprenylcysteine O-methyltransferase Ste14
MALLTGVGALAASALLDFLVSYLLAVPLEERELVERFGGRYRAYQKRVPRMFPRLGG